MLIKIPPSEEELKGMIITDPEYDIWTVADQLLVGWLYNSMTTEVASQVTSCETTQELWEALQDYYGVQASSQQDYLKRMI